MSLLGIDVGTTGCKAAAYSLDGRCLAMAYREYPTLRPRNGWAELNSAEVWKKIKSVIAEVASLTKHDPISTIGVSSMGEAVTPVAADRTILGNAILSSDVRGGEYAKALADHFSPTDLYQINPNIPGASYSYPKLAWIRDHEPKLWERADKFLLWADFVAFQLGCDPVTGFSLANRTMLFDLKREDWSDTLLERTDVPRHKLPKVRREGTVIGAVRDGIADELGLPRGVRVTVGAHDQCCNALGAGIVRPGGAVCGIGTFECITPVYETIPPASAMLAAGLNVEHHALPNLYVSFIFNQSGTLVRWFRDTFGRTGESIPSYDALAAEMPDEPTGLIVLPYFEMTGPPQFVSDASGVIAGLNLRTTRGHVLKGIMEGATYYFAWHLKALETVAIRPNRFIATGGGAKSDAWLQIKADVFGVPFDRPAIQECTCLGAAMLAGLGTGEFASPQEAADRYVRMQRTFEPDPDRHRVYTERVSRYGELFPLMRNYLRSLNCPRQ